MREEERERCEELTHEVMEATVYCLQFKTKHCLVDMLGKSCLVFYLGLQPIGWGSYTFWGTICFSQSSLALTLISFKYILIETSRRLFGHTCCFKTQKLIYKINHYWLTCQMLKKNSNDIKIKTLLLEFSSF